MKKSKKLTFSLNFDFSDSYRINRHGTRITRVKINLSYELLILWESVAKCKITKQGEVIWQFQDDSAFSLLCSTYAKTIYSDESVKELFSTMKQRKGLK